MVGIVENPQSLLDEFALVAPGQVTGPTQVTVLFDDRRVADRSFNGAARARRRDRWHSRIPSTPRRSHSLALVLGMLLVALVSIGGFTVLAQRRLRSIGMLESLGRHRPPRLDWWSAPTASSSARSARLVGFVLGLIVWLAYRPMLEQSSHHLIGVLALPVARRRRGHGARRGGHVLRRLPPGAGDHQGADRPALSGRPAPPSDPPLGVPGIVFLVAAFLLLGYSGGATAAMGAVARRTSARLVLLVPGLILLAPFFLSLSARRRSPCPDRHSARHCAIWPAIGPVRLGARRHQHRGARRRHRHRWPPRPATGTSSTTPARTFPPTK